MFVFQLFRYILAVAAVLLLSFWFSRKLGNKYRGFQTGRRVKILEQVSLSADMRLVLLEWDGKQYLIGASSHGMALLAEKDADGCSEPEGAAGMGQGSSVPAAVGKKEFSEIFQKLSGRAGKKGDGGHG